MYFGTCPPMSKTWATRWETLHSRIHQFFKVIYFSWCEVGHLLSKTQTSGLDFGRRDLVLLDLLIE